MVPGVRFRRTAPKLKVLSALSILALAACQGGGGTTTGAAITPGGSGVLGSYYVQSFAPYAPQVANLLATARYQLQQTTGWYFVDVNNNPIPPYYNSFPLLSSGAVYAHAVGLTGSGQTVAMADTRLMTSHVALAGKQITVTSNLGLGTNPSDPSFDRHGTMVASIIGGRSTSFIGIAPGASLAFGDFSTPQSLTAITQKAIQLNAVAYNNSWGFDNTTPSGADYNTYFSSGADQVYLGALAQYAARGVVVFAVSNDNTKTQSTLMDGLPVILPQLESGWLAVGNAVPTWDSSGTAIVGAQMVSSSCLDAAAWCLVADGAWKAADGTTTTGYRFGTGSSFAAPQVSGALALLAEAFPSLSPHDLRLRLIASANNDFFTPTGFTPIGTTGYTHGYNQTYGHGFLDIKAALLPIGGTSMQLEGGAVQSTNAPIIQTGAAMGDAVARSLTNVSVGVTDALNGQFRMPGQALVATTAPSPLARSLMASGMTTDLRRLRLGSMGLSDQPFSSFQGTTIASIDPNGEFMAQILLPSAGAQTASYGIDLKRLVKDGDAEFGLGLKLARDDGSIMGFGATDQGLGTQMASLEVGVTQDMGRGAFLSVGGEVGIARLGSQAALKDVSTAVFNAVHLNLGQRDLFDEGDRLTMGVSLPIAVSSGGATMVLPGMTPGVWQKVGLDLAPTDRQVNLSLTYQKPVGDEAELLMQVVHADNFGNRSGVEDMAGLLAMKFSF